MAIQLTNFSSIVSTTTLPSRLSEVIKAAAIEQLQEIKNLRQYGMIDRSPLKGDKTYLYDKLDALTDAFERGQLESFKYDAAGSTEGTGDIVEIDKGFIVTWSADNLKLQLRAAQTKAAIKKVQDKEDYKIMTALIASGALTSTVTATAVLSSSSADPVKDIAQAKRKVIALGYTPDILYIEDVNLEELLSICAANPWYETTAKAIMDGTINKFLSLKIVSLPAGKLTHGTAIVASSGAMGAHQLGIAEDITLKIFDDNETHVTKVQVWENICAIIARADAGAKITGL